MDPAEAIIEDLIEFVQGLPDTDPPTLTLNATVRETDNPLGDLQFEHTDLTILFHPHSEEEEKKGRGTYLEIITVAMLVVRKLSTEFTMRKMQNYVRDIKSALRGVKMGGYTYSIAETAIKFDPQQRKDLNQFCSVVHLSYIGFPSC